MIFGALFGVQADLSSLCSQNLYFHSYFSRYAQALHYQLNLTLHVAEKIWGPEMYFPSGLPSKVEEGFSREKKDPIFYMFIWNCAIWQVLHFKFLTLQGSTFQLSGVIF